MNVKLEPAKHTILFTEKSVPIKTFGCVTPSKHSRKQEDAR